MGSTKREDARATDAPRVDRERETTPAPASVTDASASFPSARPTSVPDYDVAAHAFEASLRLHALPSFPLDVAIPTRTGVAPPDDLELRASFLLLHVDGRSSVRDIAELTSISVADVLTALLGLTAAGLVALGGAQESSVPVSGVETRDRAKSDRAVAKKL